MHSKRGFTLIELLVVIAIIAILAAILFPVFAQARDKARAASCLSNCKQIAMGILQYTQDYDELFPPSRFNTQANDASATRFSPWSVQIYPYVKSTGVFGCPSDVTRQNAVINDVPYRWCPDAATQLVGTQRRDITKRSMAVIDRVEAGVGASPSVVMGVNWGASHAEIDRPASMIMVAERYEARGVCHSAGVHYKGPADYWTGTYIQSVQPGLRVQIAAPGAILRGYGVNEAQANANPHLFFPNRMHQGQFNVIYCDGHAKVVRWSQTYQFRGNLVEWTMWDKRLCP